LLLYAFVDGETAVSLAEAREKRDDANKTCRTRGLTALCRTENGKLAQIETRSGQGVPTPG
jgi:hypothetical protein